MSARGLCGAMALWAALTLVACGLVYRALALVESPGVWLSTRRGEGGVMETVEVSGDASAASGPCVRRVRFRGPVPLGARGLSVLLVAGRDGAEAELDGRRAHVSAEELRARGLYEVGASTGALGLAFGSDGPAVLSILSARLGASPRDVVTRGRLYRTRTEPCATPADSIVLGDETARAAVDALTRHLTENTTADGTFAYFIDGRSGASLAGSNLTRHGGTLYFLARATQWSTSLHQRAATLRAARALRDHALVECGDQRCIADGDVAWLGASALALLAFSELELQGYGTELHDAASSLARHILSVQKPDGDAAHGYDRRARRALDQPTLYYSGEAALALARFHRVDRRPEWLAGAQAILAALSRQRSRVPLAHLAPTEEHWTCLAVAELADRVPMATTWDGCLRWHRLQDALQGESGGAPPEDSGAFAFTRFVAPRTTTTATRCESAAALLSAARQGSLPLSTADRKMLERQLERGLTFLLRTHGRWTRAPYVARASNAAGAMPGSDVDPIARIDYAQHAGSALVTWLTLDSRKSR